MNEGWFFLFVALSSWLSGYVFGKSEVQGKVMKIVLEHQAEKERSQ